MKLPALAALLIVAACNSSGDPDNTGPDASTGSPDASTDGGPDVGVVDVVVSGWEALGSPATYMADVPVVFFKPDGTVGSVVKTDAMGHASAMIQRGSLVAAVGAKGDVQVDTAIANPGDTLRFGPTITSREPYGELRISWPARVVTGYTVYYYVYTPCGGSGETTSTTATIPLYKGCTASPMDVVVVSRRSSQGVTGLMSRRNVVATGGQVTVNLSDNAGTWGIASTTNVSMINSPNAGAAGASGSCSAMQYLGTLRMNGDGSSLFQDYCSMRLLPEPASTWTITAEYERLDEKYHLQMRRTFPSTAIPAFDGSGSLPYLTNVAYNTATRTITWASEADAPIDASSFRLEVRTQGRYRIWRVYAPNGLPKSYKLPALPADLADAYDILPTDTFLASIDNFEIEGVTPADLMKHSLSYDEDVFADKLRRGATARTDYPQ